MPEAAPKLLRFTVRLEVGAGSNVAVTNVVVVPMVIVQVLPLGAGQPVQLVNVEPAAAVAVSTTGEPLSKLAKHVPAQLMPAGELVTDPEAPPLRVRVTFTSNLAGTKFAVTDFAASMVSVHVPSPVHAPPQPVKSEAADKGAAVRITTSPEV